MLVTEEGLESHKKRSLVFITLGVEGHDSSKLGNIYRLIS